MEPFFIAQVCLFGGDFAPRNWAFCHGQLIAVSQNEALFSLLGTTYGGDGETTFGLPDFRGRIPVGVGTGAGLSTISLGERGGVPQQNLTQANLPQHTHIPTAVVGTSTASGNTGNPGGAVVAQAPDNLYSAVANATGAFGAVTAATQPKGGTTAINMHMPSMGMHYIIALTGVYPSPS